MWQLKRLGGHWAEAYVSLYEVTVNISYLFKSLTALLKTGKMTTNRCKTISR